MLSDILNSLSKIKTLFYLASLEIKYKYTRTTLGALWNTLTALIFIFIVSSVYSYILNENQSNLFLYSSIGYIFWLFCSSIIIESLTVIIDNKAILQDIKINIIDLFLRLLVKNFIILLHNSLIIIVSIYFYSEGISLLNIFIFVINFLLVVCILFFVSIILAISALVYRDLIHLVNTSMFLFFLITPIFWTTKTSINTFFVFYNPFLYIIDILRYPLLNQSIPIQSYFVVIAMLLILIFLSTFCYKKSKQLYYLF